ncbi:MAG: hypothetical protein AAB490_06360 [Patescibacteria group bacterium]
MLKEAFERSGGFKLALFFYFMGLIAVPGRGLLTSLDPKSFQPVTGGEALWLSVFMFALGLFSERAPYERLSRRMLCRALHGLFFAAPLFLGMATGLLVGW